MKKIRCFLLLALCCTLFTISQVLAQRASVAVDHFSGSAQVNLPFMNLQWGSISVPIGISYNGGGVKVKEAEGSAGMGWNMYAGGQISRQVRGLPDDVHLDNANEARVGWINGPNGTKVNNFTIANDNDPGTWQDEMDDYDYMAANFFDLSDTEPDIFYVSAPGLNCKLVFDNSLNIKTIPYQDIKVTYTTNAIGNSSYIDFGKITSFTITTSTGLTYIFDKMENSSRQTSSSSPSTIEFFKHEYDLYKNRVSFTSAWKLGSITDLTGHVLTFEYETLNPTNGKDPLVMVRDAAVAMTPFTIATTTSQTRLRVITADDAVSFYTQSNNSVSFDYTEAETSRVSLLSGISGMGKSISFDYVQAKTENINEKKAYLISAGTGLDQHTFKYYGLSGNVVSLPDSTSKEIDLWGYYNNSSASSLFPDVYINTGTGGYEMIRHMPVGSASAVYPYSISGTDRQTNSSYITNGSLSDIEYIEGGKTTITYEPNDYIDPTKGTVSVGGGIRVKKLTDYDALSPANSVNTYYSYINPSTGVTSGKAISIPSLAFISTYLSGTTAEEQWKNSIIRLEENLSQENNAIAYSHVKVSRSGIGSSVYEYSLPATHWDSSASPDYTKTVINIGFPLGYIANDTDTYPFVPNTNYDFERGLLNKVTQFNESGDKVAETAYNYERTNSPVVISAFKFDDNSGSPAYAKYYIYSSVGKLTSQVTNRVYDAPSTTNYNQTTTNYYYNGNHKLPTLVQQTNSDGSISRSYTKYLKDYNVSTHSDDMTTAIYNLQQAWVNMPIETYSQLERNSVNKTISASLMKLKPITMTSSAVFNLPVQHLALLRADGLTDFAPSAISSGTFAIDSRYKVKQNILSYQQDGTPLTIDDNKRNAQTTITHKEKGRPAAIFSNAIHTEVAYGDFDYTDPECAFTKNVALTATSNSRSGKWCDSAVVGNTFTRTITMGITRSHYIFSIWIKATGNGTVSLALTNSSSSTSTYSLSFANTSGQWKYHTIKVPVTNMSTTFTAQFSSDANIFIDDVLFYPADATVGTSDYQERSYYVSSTTDRNGNAQYFENDVLGRPTRVWDQNKNLLIKKTYLSKINQHPGASISHDMNYTAIPISFSGPGGRPDDYLVYTYNFGDGTAEVTTSAIMGSVFHTYTAPGNYVVTLTVNSALFGSVTSTDTLTLTAAPAQFTGVGDLVVTLYDGATLLGSFSGTSLYALNTIPSGVYTVQISTGQDPYSTSFPNGFKRWQIGTYNYGTNTYAGEICFPSAPNEKNNTFNLNFLPGYRYTFELGDVECVIE